MTNRYGTTNNIEAQFEPGSYGRVLANKLGISDPAEMDDIELDLLNRLHEGVIDSVEADQRITVADFREWHRRWLGNVYVWAGRYRTLNMGKGRFPVCGERSNSEAHGQSGQGNVFGSIPPVRDCPKIN